MPMNRYTVNKTIQLKANPAKVWEALTTPAITKKYFFSCETISTWEEGSSIVYKADQTIHIKGTIVKIRPGTFLEYTFLPAATPDLPANYMKVSWELTAEDGETTLEITQGTFYDESKYNDSVAGWDYVLKGLKSLLKA